MIAGLDAVDGRPLVSRNQQLHFNIVGPRFLETMGVAIVDGRDFRDADDERATPKAIISASLARRLFAHASAVGRSLEKEGRRFEVVGVAADVLVARACGKSPATQSTSRISRYESSPRNWPSR